QVEDRVNQRLRDCAQRSEGAHASVGKEDVDLPSLALDGLVQPIQVAVLRHITGDRNDAWSEPTRCSSEFVGVPARHEDARTFLGEERSRREPDAAASTGHDCHPSLKSAAHRVLTSLIMYRLVCNYIWCAFCQESANVSRVKVR